FEARIRRSLPNRWQETPVLYPVCFDDFSAVSPLRSPPIRAYTVPIRVTQRAAMTSTLPVFDDLIASDDLPALRVASGIEDCNRAAGALFGSPADSLRGLPLIRLMPERQPDGSDSSGAWRERVDAASQGLPQWFLWQFVRPDGGIIDALVHLTADTRGDGAG